MKSAWLLRRSLVPSITQQEDYSVGPEGWVGHSEWPLTWLQAVSQTKVTSFLVATHCLCLMGPGVERVLLEQMAPRLPSLHQVQLLESPLPFPRPDIWPRSCPCLLLVPTAFAEQCGISCGRADWSSLPSRSFIYRLPRGGSTFPPSPPGPCTAGEPGLPQPGWWRQPCRSHRQLGGALPERQNPISWR